MRYCLLIKNGKNCFTVEKGEYKNVKYCKGRRVTEGATMKLYRDTETGEILTEAQLKEEFEVLKAQQPETYDYTFSQYLKNCTSKNGFLELIKIMILYGGFENVY